MDERDPEAHLAHAKNQPRLHDSILHSSSIRSLWRPSRFKCHLMTVERRVRRADATAQTQSPRDLVEVVGCSSQKPADPNLQQTQLRQH